ncbi:MAG: MBL fold metallo-hydrolase [Prevotellaceae bacterium]|jgi:glyoxylase-like metal-dependent hydrolase (beta-lactamase superfamily II)|nr:MBL fold metallo-hydrolase [Prevotellaceae bacterium]
MIQIKTFYFNELRVCTYLLWDATRECLIVDPGCESAGEQQRLRKFIADNALVPVLAVNTHGHFDHVLGNLFVTRTYAIPSAIHAADGPLLTKTAQQAALFGFQAEQPPEATILLTEDRPVCFGHAQLQALHTPGHTPGGICLYAPEAGFVLSGDTLFAGSIGRTDLPGGDYDALLDSIHTKLMTLPDGVAVYPGHGPETTIGEERRNNPFI